MTCPPNWVCLNVGGKVFQTSKQTLSRESDSFLARLVSDDQSFPIAKDGDGAILIDRNPECFQIVLDYLRTGRFTLPENVNYEQLMEEIDFYGLPALYALVYEAKRHPRKKPDEVVESVQMNHVPSRPSWAQNAHFIVVTSNVSPDNAVLKEFEPERRSLVVTRLSAGRYLINVDENGSDYASVLLRLRDSIITVGFALTSSDESPWAYTRTVEL